MRGFITSAKLGVMGIVLVGLGGIGWAQANSDEAAASADAGQIQALAQAFHVSPQVVEELRANHATQGWGAVALHLAQAQPPARTEPVAVPSDTVQVHALARAFHVSPQVVEELWANQATQGWGAVALPLAQAQPPAQTEPVAVPSHTVQVHALARAFHVSPQVVEELWATHAKHGWGAVAVHLAQAPSPAQTDVVIASTER
jgi:hypothetical protein